MFKLGKSASQILYIILYIILYLFFVFVAILKNFLQGVSKLYYSFYYIYCNIIFYQMKGKYLEMYCS